MEKWKPIKGYEWLYEVSDLGRVRRACRGKTGTPKGYILKNQKNKRLGYMHVMLEKEGRKSPHRVHILVARAFLGDPPFGKEVGHKNEMKDDPRLENLHYVTHSQNLKSSCARRKIKRRPDGTFLKFQKLPCRLAD
jgi:NUMOD4 motif-containing protein/HNH endonuclease